MRASWSWLRRVGGQPRLLLAAKTAAAAALAWYLAPLLPFDADKYSYYAPMGVVVSMYPTLFRSLRVGLQSLASLAIGIALGMAVILLPVPDVVGLVIAIGVGVLLAGFRFLGSASSWVPIAAMFVLLLGGGRAEDYSLGYLVNVLFGIVIGAVVNLVIAPPVPVAAATNKLNALREHVAEHLRRLATALEQASTGGWSSALQRLEETADEVRNAVQHADESRRGNPRGRRTAEQLGEDYARLRALERVLFLVRDLTDVVGHGSVAGAASSSERLRSRVADGVRATAELVGAPVGAEDAPELLREAEEAVAAVGRTADEEVGWPSEALDVATVSLALRRIIEAARPFAAEDDERPRQD